MGRQRDRMERRTRAGAITSLNIISLMDIFTILLLFLLVQTGDPNEVLPVIENLHLPYSEAKAPPQRNLVVAIDGERIMVEGRTVATITEVRETADNLIAPLAAALRAYVAEAAQQGRETGARFRGDITIMGDREIPFSVLKKVMYTCASQHFGHISLAVQPADKPG
ncbi:MAG: ExbD/TolR family protein [Leptospirillia bacterium]